MLEAAILAKEIEPDQDIDSTPVYDATELTRGGSLAKV